MNAIESVRMAFASLRANAMRTVLTMLGVIIGTGAVIGLLSVGQGAQAEVAGQIRDIGSNLIFIVPGSLTEDQAQALVRPPKSLTLEDAEAIAKDPYAVHVAAVAPQIEGTVTAFYQGTSVQVRLIGTTSDYESVRNYHPALGRFFSPNEDTLAARVAVLGMQTARDLFGDPALALEQKIRINRLPFTVVGVIEEKGGVGPMGASMDRFIIVPIRTATERLFTREVGTAKTPVDMIYASAVDEASMDLAMEEIRQVLRYTRNIAFKEDDFTVASQDQILSVADQIGSIFNIVLASIAGISLLVGGIGIMNIMLVSVTERTREIGIRKAVGAKRADILRQFLIESMVLSVIGGAAGIGVGWLLASIVDRVATFTTLVTPGAVALAVGFSLAVGLFFGIYPARQAARLDPIQALRYE